MKYKISYDQFGASKRITRTGMILKMGGYLVAVCAIFGLMLWSVGVDLHTTGEALEELAIDLSSGDGVEEAFSNFCLEILRGA